jgi:hypothetical protein
VNGHGKSGLLLAAFLYVLTFRIAVLGGIPGRFSVEMVALKVLEGAQLPISFGCVEGRLLASSRDESHATVCGSLPMRGGLRRSMTSWVELKPGKRI